MGMVRRRRQPTGTMGQQRKRHLQRQARQDAINRLKAGETVSIMAFAEGLEPDGRPRAGYRRFTVRPIGVDELFDACTVLTLREHKVWASFYYLKDGKEVHVTGGRHVPAGKVFGIVVDSEMFKEARIT